MKPGYPYFHRAGRCVFPKAHSRAEIVWQIGPDFSKTKELRKLGWIIGQHHFHMIPKGLPGEGNLLVFDNGGEGGYGNPNPSAPMTQPACRMQRLPMRQS